MTKAYDSVPRDLLFSTLESEGIPRKLLNILRSLYTDTMIRVRVGQEMGKEARVETGVLQGCVLSPLLFNLFLNGIVRRVEKKLEKGGIKLVVRETPRGPTREVPLWILLYADDIMITAETEAGLKRMMKTLDEELTKHGMKISGSKTQVMLGAHTPALTSPVVLGGQPLETVSRFKYCGGMVTSDGKAATEVEERRKAATRAFESFQVRVFRNKQLSTAVKMKVYRTTVLATLLYGTETWNVRADDMKRLEAFHHNCLRRILRISYLDRVTNDEVRRRAGIPTVTELMQGRRMRWAGHVARMPWSRAPRIAMEGRCKGARPFCGTAQRWRDVVRSDLPIELKAPAEWKAAAQDRAAWRKIVGRAVEEGQTARAEKQAKRKAERERPPASAFGPVDESLFCRFGKCEFVAQNRGGLTLHQKKCSHRPRDGDGSAGAAGSSSGRSRPRRRGAAASGENAAAAAAAAAPAGPYVCNVCGRGFARACNLATHHRHSGHQ